jgi:hypothetical protein
LGIDTKIGPTSSVEVSASEGEEIYHHAVDANTINMDRVLTPRMDLGLSQELFRAKPFTLGLGFRVGLLLPASGSDYTTKLGYAYQAALFLKQFDPKLSDFARLRLSAIYNEVRQNSSILNQVRRDLGLELSYGWSFGR